MSFDFLQPHVVTAAGTLLGVAIGGYFTTRAQRRERQQQHIRRQLTEFYGPMLALRAQILAKSELRLKVSSAANFAWHKSIERAQAKGFEVVSKKLEEQRPSYSKIVDDENRIFAEDILPAYRKMIEIFSSGMYLAEPVTMIHFPALVEFVEIWNRSLEKGLPGEVIKELDHSEKNLHPLYEDLADNFYRLQGLLKERRRWWWNRTPTVKVLPSR